MSTATEQQLATRPVVEALSSGVAKRKRSRSSGNEAEDPSSIAKKKTLANGEAVDGVATTETSEEQSVRERVVILDAGAQYGKVSMHEIDTRSLLIQITLTIIACDHQQIT